MPSLQRNAFHTTPLFVTFALLLTVLAGTVVHGNMPTEAMMPSVASGSTASAPSALSLRQAVATRLLLRLNQAQKKMTAKTTPLVIAPHASARLIRLKAAAPDDPASLSVRPTVVPEKSGCGDGIVIAPEACDDGNTVSGDGCSADCLTLEPGFVCNYLAQPTLCHEQCGNGMTTTNETCDDGNTVDGDGCSRYCRTEIGYSCTKDSPSVCTPY